MEGNASVHQVNPVGGITGEGRADFSRTGEPGFDQKGVGVGGGGGGTGGAAQFVRGNYKSFKGINLTGLERKHQFIMGDGRGSSIYAWKLYIV